jgi:phage terminase Nu1 subunit (DNA packaging protein)
MSLKSEVSFLEPTPSSTNTRTKQIPPYIGAHMDEKTTKISAKEASKIADCSIRKIQKMVKTGVISAQRGEGGKYLIDKSEFYRVFPERMERPETKPVREPSEQELKLLREQNEFLKEQLKIANEEKKSLLKTLESTQRLIELKPRKKFLRIF